MAKKKQDIATLGPLSEAIAAFAEKRTKKVKKPGRRLTMKIKIKTGKGVMSKDGKTPFAAGTMFYTQDGWKSPMAFDVHNLMAALMQPTVDEVQIIDQNNNEFIITVEK